MNREVLEFESLIRNWFDELSDKISGEGNSRFKGRKVTVLGKGALADKIQFWGEVIGVRWDNDPSLGIFFYVREEGEPQKTRLVEGDRCVFEE